MFVLILHSTKHMLSLQTGDTGTPDFVTWGPGCLRQRLDTHRKGASSTTTVMPLDSHSGVSGAMPKRHSSRFLLRVQLTGKALEPMFVRPTGSSTDASDEQP